MDPHQWVRFVECHPGLAGYVQAAGVILTILGAMFWPLLKRLYDRWLRSRARRQNTRRYAFAVLHMIEEIIAGFDLRLRRLREERGAPNWLNFQEGLSIVIPMALEIANLSVEEFNVEKLRDIQALCEALRGWNMRTWEYRGGAAPSDDEAWQAMAFEMLARAEKVRAKAFQARAAIRALGRPPTNTRSS
jgi:hypothetical protein